MTTDDPGEAYALGQADGFDEGAESERDAVLGVLRTLSQGSVSRQTLANAIAHIERRGQPR